MKFVIAPDKTFWWPVKVKTPSEKNVGTFDVQKFEAQFNIVHRDEAQKIENDIREIEDPIEREKSIDNVIRKAFVGWRGVADEQGNEVPFSVDTLNQCLGFAWFRHAVYEAYSGFMSGDAAKVKN